MYMYVCIYVCMYIYIYIYIERERERERYDVCQPSFNQPGGSPHMHEVGDACSCGLQQGDEMRLRSLNGAGGNQ